MFDHIGYNILGLTFLLMTLGFAGDGLCSLIKELMAALPRTPDQEVNRIDTGRKLKDGEPCSHTGCLSHTTHPCERCGRIGGVTDEELPAGCANCRSTLPCEETCGADPFK